MGLHRIITKLIDEEKKSNPKRWAFSLKIAAYAYE
jgi:hypothetical protein